MFSRAEPELLGALPSMMFSEFSQQTVVCGLRKAQKRVVCLFSSFKFLVLGVHFNTPAVLLTVVF